MSPKASSYLTRIGLMALLTLAFLPSLAHAGDRDGDGVSDNQDNCDCMKNSDQANLDGDSKGDTCDPDADGDGVYPTGKSITDCTSSGGTNSVDTWTTYGEDCNDRDEMMHGAWPAQGIEAAEEICDTKDNDCDGFADEGLDVTSYPDADKDGYGDSQAEGLVNCAMPYGYVKNDDDCNDSNASVHPGATEITGDGIDQNCDGKETCYKDADNDGYRHSSNIVSSSDTDCKDSGEATSTDYGGDCNDSDPAIHPGATEICDGKDNDCDGSADEGLKTTYYKDKDGDLYGGDSWTTACAAPTGFVTNSDDCNDNNAAIHPGATEICNGIDDDCDGSVDEGMIGPIWYMDNDKDSYGETKGIQSCSQPTGYVSDHSDCDDKNASIHPGAKEICNTLDDDCDGLIDEGVGDSWYLDSDQDQYGASIGLIACSQPNRVCQRQQRLQ